MASDAKAILSHPRSDTSLQIEPVTMWLKRNRNIALVCMGAFLYGATVFAGLRLFDNDYDWINEAQDTGWLQILWDVFRPIPEQWGFQDRPFQVFSFKVLYGIFGYSATGYYTFKAMLFAGVCFGLARLSIALKMGETAAILTALIFALSTSGHASALWVSDFELLAEILILAAFGVFWRTLNSEPHTRTNEFLGQAMFVLLSVVAHRTKGSAKLIPGIVLIYLFLYRRDQIRRYLPSIALILLTIVPVFSVISNPVPPFAPFAEDQSQGWKWKPANFETLSTIVAGNFHPIYGTDGPDIAYSILSVLAPALLWAGLAAGVFLGLKGRNSFSSAGWGFLSVWTAVVIASYASFPRLPEGFMARYVVVGLVPISLLLGGVLARVSELIRPKMAIPAMVCLLTLHAGHNFGSTRHLRNTLGQLIVAYDLGREYVTAHISDSDVLVIGFDYGYHRRTNDTNRYYRETLKIGSTDQPGSFHVLIRTDQNMDKIEHQSTIEQIQKSVSFPKTDRLIKVGIRPLQTFSGLTNTLYDKHIYRNRQAFAGILYNVSYGPKKS